LGLGESAGARGSGSQPGADCGEVGAAILAEDDDFAVEDHVGQALSRTEYVGKLVVARATGAGTQGKGPVDCPQLPPGAVDFRAALNLRRLLNLDRCPEQQPRRSRQADSACRPQ
jgi:hypothetical protein